MGTAVEVQRRPKLFGRVAGPKSGLNAAACKQSSCMRSSASIYALEMDAGSKMSSRQMLGRVTSKEPEGCRSGAGVGEGMADGKKGTTLKVMLSRLYRQRSAVLTYAIALT